MKFEQIIADLQRKIYHPIYLLQGEEGFFLDEISDYIEKHVLEESEKDFNQTVLYGAETDVEAILSVAKRFPMMASHNVVIVKEAQNVKKIEELESYVSQPLETTILVLVYKHKTVDQRKKFGKLISKKAVVFTSKKLYESDAINWAQKYAQDKQLALPPKASLLLIESLGTELSKIANEINKLAVVLKPGAEISLEVIEKNIGISKDYNVFELTKAMAQKDVQKANRIVQHFGKNPKLYPLQMLLPGIYMFFSKVLLFHSVKNEQDRVIMSKLGVPAFIVKEYKLAGKNYPVKKLARIISYLRECDNKSKGIGNHNTSSSDLLKEFVFKAMH